MPLLRQWTVGQIALRFVKRGRVEGPIRSSHRLLDRPRARRPPAKGIILNLVQDAVVSGFGEPARETLLEADEPDGADTSQPTSCMLDDAEHRTLWVRTEEG